MQDKEEQQKLIARNIDYIEIDKKGEKIDIVNWSEDIAEFIKNALSPSKVYEVTVYEALHKVELSIVEMSGRITTMEGSMERIAQSVNELKEKPAKRWDGIVDKIITAIVTAFITYIVTTTWLNHL